jgi:hypothetical protein
MSNSEPQTTIKSWSIKEDAILRKHVGHYSMRKIGEMLGRTKNSVIGRANRLMLLTGYRKFTK